MEDKGESKFRNVMERYWYALFIIAVALAAAVIGFICEAWKMQEGFLYDLLTSIISTTIAFFLFSRYRLYGSFTHCGKLQKNTNVGT